MSSFGSKLTLSAELYETAGNKLIASFNGRGADVEELLDIIKEKTPEFFRSVKDGFAAFANAPNAEMVMVDTTKFVEEPRAEEIMPEEINQEESLSAETESEKSGGEYSRAEVAYDELDGKQSTNMWESIPADVDNEPVKRGGIRWVPLSISAVVTTVGVVAAVVGNQKAKEESEKTYATAEEYERYHQNAKDYQTTRTVGTIIAIVGAIGIGLSIAF